MAQNLDDVLELLIPIIQEFEGCKLMAYKCPAGVWTCGWGETGPGIGPYTKWTQEIADNILRHTASLVLADLIDASPSLVDASTNRIAALADFVYNLGIGAYKKSSLKLRVDQGNWASAATEIKKWDKCKGEPLAGLTRRRAIEAEMLK